MKTVDYIITQASAEVISRDRLYLLLQIGYTIFTGGFTEPYSWFFINQAFLRFTDYLLAGVTFPVGAGL
jgi:hypothetical protein